MHESGSTNTDLENEPEVEETSTSDDIENETEEPSMSFTSAPSDIAQRICEKPVQPHNVTFPKENGRSFSVSWYSKHTWLEYSVSKDAAYCYAFRFFSSGAHKGDECFVLSGYRNWKKATGMSGRLRKHTLSHRHIDAVAAGSDYLRNQRSQTSITSTLSQARRDQILQNRHYLKTILEVLMYCAVHEIALCGHRESADSRNKGNFLGLLDMISNHDTAVKNKVQNGPRNAVYTSHGIQDDPLKLLGNNVVSIICNKVRVGVLQHHCR